MKMKIFLSSLQITLILVIIVILPFKARAQESYNVLKTESAIVITQPKRTSDVVKNTITNPVSTHPTTTSVVKKESVTSKIENSITTSVIEQSIVTSVVEQPITTSVIEQPITTSIIEQPITTSVIEQPITTSVIEQPITTSVIEQPITTSIIEQPITTSIIEQPITTLIIEKTTITTEVIIETSTETSAQTTTITTTVVVIPENYIHFASLDVEPLEIVVMPANQKNVDNYDIVLDNELFSTENNLLFFGHVHNSFQYIDRIKVNEEIILCLDGIPQKYTVVISEEGSINTANTDIINKDEISLLYTPIDEETTIRLITCRPLFFGNSKLRWVVVAKLID